MVEDSSVVHAHDPKFDGARRMEPQRPHLTDTPPPANAPKTKITHSTPTTLNQADYPCSYDILGLSTAPHFSSRVGLRARRLPGRLDPVRRPDRCPDRAGTRLRPLPGLPLPGRRPPPPPHLALPPRRPACPRPRRPPPPAHHHPGPGPRRLPRPRRAAADPGMGPPALGEPALRGTGAVDRGGSGRGVGAPRGGGGRGRGNGARRARWIPARGRRSRRGTGSASGLTTEQEARRTER